MRKLFLLIILSGILRYAEAQNCPCGNNINLFINGDFESGVLLPSLTEMNEWNVNCNLEFGCYSILNSASEVGGQFNGAPHGGQKFMFVDGQDFSPGDEPQLVWSQTTDCLIPGESYSFRFWIRGCSGFGDIFVLNALVTANGATTWLNENSLINTMMNNSNDLPDWHQYSFNWTATSETATFSLEQISFSSSGFDFGLDDIRLMGDSGMELDLDGGATIISCAGDPGEITVDAVNGTSPFSFELSNASGTIQQLNAVSQVEFAVSDPGTYTIEVTDAGNCQSEIEIEITQEKLMTNILAVEPTCSNSGTAMLIPVGGDSPYSLSVNGISQPNAEIMVTEGSYELELSDANGCIVDTTLHFATDNPVVADFSLSLENGMIITDNESLHADSFNWEINGSGMIDAEDLAPFSAEGPATYEIELWAVDAFTGCMDHIIKSILIEGDFALYAPNCITADDDGINDYFFVRGEAERLKSFQYQIFNRWGEMVFTTTDLHVPWDGQVKGGSHFAQDGIYTYVIHYEMRDEPGMLEIIGHLTVLR